MTWKRGAVLVALVCYVIFWLGGIGSYAFGDGPPKEVAWASFLFLPVTAVLLLWLQGPGQRLALSLGGLLGFGVEVLGVHTGFPFGHYAYTSHLGPSLFGVPLALAAAWIVLLAYGLDLGGRLLGSVELVGARGGAWRGVLRCLIAAIWMTAVDLIIDPLAAGPLGYWRWDAVEGGWFGVPWSNFLGWLVVSALLAAVAQSLIGSLRSAIKLGPTTRRMSAAQGFGAAILLFFTCIAAAQGLGVVALLGLGLLGIDFAIWRRQERGSRLAVRPTARHES